MTNGRWRKSTLTAVRIALIVSLYGKNNSNLQSYDKLFYFHLPFSCYFTKYWKIIKFIVKFFARRLLALPVSVFYFDHHNWTGQAFLKWLFFICKEATFANGSLCSSPKVTPAEKLRLLKLFNEDIRKLQRRFSNTHTKLYFLAV